MCSTTKDEKRRLIPNLLSTLGAMVFLVLFRKEKQVAEPLTKLLHDLPFSTRRVFRYWLFEVGDAERRYNRGVIAAIANVPMTAKSIQVHGPGPDIHCDE